MKDGKITQKVEKKDFSRLETEMKAFAIGNIIDRLALQ
jgi:hypothetical protein